VSSATARHAGDSARTATSIGPENSETVVGATSIKATSEKCGASCKCEGPSRCNGRPQFTESLGHSVGADGQAGRAAFQAFEWASAATRSASDQFWRISKIRTSLQVATANDRSSDWIEADHFLAGLQTIHSIQGGSVSELLLAQSLFADSPASAVDAQSLFRDGWGTDETEKLEDILNLFLAIIMGLLRLTCRCDLEYGEEFLLGYRVRCFIKITCTGTAPWCNFSGELDVPCKPWWYDLPECPKQEKDMREGVRTTWERGRAVSDWIDAWMGVREPRNESDVSWCDEGKNSRHRNTDRCYRQIVSKGPGQQCCYKDGQLVSEGEGAGTPDMVGAARAIGSDGSCGFSLFAVIDHWLNDVRTSEFLTWERYHDGWPPSGSAKQVRQRAEYERGLRLQGVQLHR
jgi:hypothetical protein